MGLDQPRRSLNRPVTGSNKPGEDGSRDGPEFWSRSGSFALRSSPEPSAPPCRLLVPDLLPEGPCPFRELCAVERPLEPASSLGLADWSLARSDVVRSGLTPSAPSDLALSDTEERIEEIESRSQSAHRVLT